MTLFDYLRGVNQIKALLAKPFLFKVKEKFLGREGDNFQNATLEIFKATGYNYFSSSIPLFIEYPVILGLFFTLYHPISILFPDLRASLPILSETALGITTKGFEELNIIEAVRQSPESFAGFNISGIIDMKSSIFGIDILHTAKMGNITMILPIIAIAYYLYAAIKLLLPVFKKQKKIRDVAVVLSLYIIVGCSITVSAFSLPLVFYCYLIVFITISNITNRMINKYIIKTKEPWVKKQNSVCQEILKKYGITEYVSAIKKNSPAPAENNQKDIKN